MARKVQLDRLYAGLSARERVLLLRGGSFVGEAEERAIRATMPPEQREEFTRLSGLAYNAVQFLTPVVHDLSHQVTVLALRWLLLHAIARCGFERSAHASDAALRAHVPIEGSEHQRLVAEADTFGPSDIALVLSALAGSWGSAGNDTSWNEVMCLLAEQLRTGLRDAWERLLAIERVADDVCRRFGDEAVLPERLRAQLGMAHADLQAVHDVASPLAGEVAAPAADEHSIMVLTGAIFGSQDAFRQR